MDSSVERRGMYVNIVGTTATEPEFTNRHIGGKQVVIPVNFYASSISVPLHDSLLHILDGASTRLKGNDPVLSIPLPTYTKSAINCRAWHEIKSDQISLVPPVHQEPLFPPSHAQASHRHQASQGARLRFHALLCFSLGRLAVWIGGLTGDVQLASAVPISKTLTDRSGILAVSMPCADDRGEAKGYEFIQQDSQSLIPGTGMDPG
ncbi:hypothetical protein VTL71DRAFT_12316 [Oculimacula yallundae]|uniref:Uncharacterized protein n=1 Tax=Oculimacula yallundae TaxID=86028 RepID=A0ABR4CM78_9HELO